MAPHNAGRMSVVTGRMRRSMSPQNKARQDAHKESAVGLQQRVSRAVRRNEHKLRLADCFTVLRKGLMHDHNELRWLVLDPANASLEIWDYPPEQDAASLDPNVLAKLSKASSSLLSKASSKSQSPKAPLKTLDLENLRNVDSNPHFYNIFFGFTGSKGGGSYCLTAPNQDVFEAWMAGLTGYDVFDAFDATRSRPALKNLPMFQDLLHK